jgi:hypothetical protein
MGDNNTPTWARETIDNLDRMKAAAREHLTRVEYDLIITADLLLRARFGETTMDDSHDVARDMLRAALRTLDAEAGA